MWSHHNKNCPSVMTYATLSFEDRVWLAIERLLKTSGRESWNVVSIVDEASRYCYKTVSGEIGVVSKKFIHDIM